MNNNWHFHHNDRDNPKQQKFALLGQHYRNYQLLLLMLRKICDILFESPNRINLFMQKITKQSVSEMPNANEVSKVVEEVVAHLESLNELMPIIQKYVGGSGQFFEMVSTFVGTSQETNRLSQERKKPGPIKGKKRKGIKQDTYKWRVLVMLTESDTSMLPSQLVNEYKDRRLPEWDNESLANGVRTALWQAKKGGFVSYDEQTRRYQITSLGAELIAPKEAELDDSGTSSTTLQRQEPQALNNTISQEHYESGFENARSDRSG